MRQPHAGFDIMEVLEPPATPRRKRRELIGVAALLATVTNAVAFMFPPLLPLLEARYHLGLAAETWIFTAMTLGGGAGFILLPRLSDVLSDRRTALLAGGLLTGGALVPAIGDTYASLLAGAALLGVGSAAQLLPLGFLRRHLAGGRVSTAVSVLIMATGGGVVAGMIGGGIVVRNLSIPGFFTLMALVFAGTTWALLAVIPKAKAESSGHLGLLGTVWLIGWVTAVLLALTQGQLWGGYALIPLVLGVVGYFTWKRAQRRSSAPVFDLRVTRMPYVRTALFAAAGFGAVDAGFLLLVTYYVQTPRAAGYGLGYDALQTGLLMLPFALTMFISGKAAEKQVAKGRPGEVLLLGAAVSAIGVAFLAVDHQDWWAYLIGAGLVGLGSRAGYSGAFAVPQLLVEERKAGMAAGMGGTTMAIGIAVGSALVSATLLAAPDPRTQLPVASAYGEGYALMLLCTLSVVVAALVASRRQHRSFKALLRQNGVLVPARATS